MPWYGGGVKISNVKHKTRLNLVLIVVVVTLATFLISTEQETDNEVNTIAKIAPESIQRITLRKTGRSDIVFNKTNDSWMMTTPYTAIASRFRITSMLQFLQQPSTSQLHIIGLDLEHFQLAQPNVVLIFNNHEFAFGTTNQIDNQRYVRYGDQLHLINDPLYPQLTQNAEFFISTRLLPEDTQLKRMQFPNHILTMNSEQWQIEPALAVDNDTLKQLVEAWLNTSAMRVTANTTTASSTIITLETNQDRTIRFNIIKQPSELILARTDLGIQYHLNNYQAEQLFLKTLLATEVTEVTESSVVQ